jgi:hypothetical protein
MLSPLPQVYISKLTCVKSFILAADAFYSIYLLRYLEEDKSLSLIARDYDRVCAGRLKN